MLHMLLAQVIEAPVPPDWSAIAVTLITAAQAALITVVVWLTKRAAPKLPRAAMPILALLIGGAVSTLLAWSTGGELSPVYAALVGTAAVWLREVQHTIREHGTEP